MGSEREKKDPRQHQWAAIKAAVAGFGKHRRGQVIMPCGTGKTRVGMHVAAELKARKVAVLAPSLALVDQTARAWMEQSPVTLEPLLVCSAKDGGGRSGDGDREIVPDFAGFEVTTDSDRIKAFLRGAGTRVVFGTYASSARLAGAGFDLIIFDEAHRTAGFASKAKAKAWSVALHDSEVKAKRRLFMTATPRLAKEGADEDAVVFSMSDREVYGPVFHEMTFREAQDLGLLVPFEIVVMGVTREDVRDMLTKDPTGDLRSLAAAVVLEKCREQFGVTRAISYHNRVQRAADFAGMVRGLQPSAHVSGEMPAQERDAVLDRFKAEGGLVANARCLVEGVDIPSVDAVVIADPRTSPVDIVQATGRALRLSPGKTRALVILPVLEEHAEDGTLRGEFRHIGQTLNALKAQDAAITAAIKRATGGGAASPGVDGWPGPKVIIDVSPGAGEEFRASIEARVLGRQGMIDRSWWETYEKCREWVELHGRLPSKEAKATERRLGDWLAWARAVRKGTAEGAWDQQKDQALDALLGMAKSRNDAWWETYEQCREWVEAHGESPSRRAINPDERRLGLWLARTRQVRKGMANGTWDKQKEEAMAYLPGPRWSPGDWWERYKQCRKWVEDHGRSPSMKAKDPSERRLGLWLARTRQVRKGTAKGTWDQQRDQAIEDLLSLKPTQSEPRRIDK